LPRINSNILKYKSINDLVINPPIPVTGFFSDFIWNIDTIKKELFLTFDDGPVPELTEKVLDILDLYNAKATFFNVGHNVRKYPEIYREILNRGHTTGNHTYNHLNGYKTSAKEYLENVKKASKYIKSPLFRPPYGKITAKQWFAIKKHYKVVLWNVLSQDYSQTIEAEQCSENVRRFAKPGSIIVFHDNYKAEKNMLTALTNTLIHYTKEGWRFKKIEYQSL
jgi:peptidoglycan/xylan/chitin deacetylase (PgdA/CDA1 family)